MQNFADGTRQSNKLTDSDAVRHRYTATEMAFQRADLKIFPSKWVLTCDIVSAAVWLYALSKLFVFDLDNAFVELIGIQALNVPLYKLSAILLVFFVLAVFQGRRRVLGLIAYIVAFPVLILVWKIPFVLVRLGSWSVGLAFLSTFLDLFSDIKYKLLIYAVYIAAGLTIFTSSNRMALIISILALCVSVTVTYARAFLSPFRMSKMLGIYRHLFPFLSSRPEVVSGNENRGIPLTDLNGKELTDRVSSLQIAILTNRSTLYFANRLRDFNRSHFAIFVGLISFIYLILISLFWFFVIYWGLELVNPDSFRSAQAITYFDAFNLSFDNMLFSSNNSIDFNSISAKSVSMLQRFLTAMWALIFISILLNVKQQRFEREINETVGVIEAAGTELEEKIKADYRFASIDEAIHELKRLESGFADFIIKLSNSLGR